jgi:hypothetical protein
MLDASEHCFCFVCDIIDWIDTQHSTLILPTVSSNSYYAQVVIECTRHHREGKQEHQDLSDYIRTKLHDLVGESYWRRSQIYTDKYFNIYHNTQRTHKLSDNQINSPMTSSIWMFTISHFLSPATTQDGDHPFSCIGYSCTISMRLLHIHILNQFGNDFNFSMFTPIPIWFTTALLLSRNRFIK